MPVASPEADAHLRTFLNNQDVACPSCAYNLRGLTTSRCPECDQELELAVRLAEPRLGVFLFGLIGICASLGFCGMLLAWVGLMALRGRIGPPFRDMVPLLLGLGVCAVMSWAWIRYRRGFAQRPFASRLVIAMVAIAIAAVCPLWFMWTVR